MTLPVAGFGAGPSAVSSLVWWALNLRRSARSSYAQLFPIQGRSLESRPSQIPSDPERPRDMIQVGPGEGPLTFTLALGVGWPRKPRGGGPQRRRPMCKGGEPRARRGTDRPHSGSSHEQECPPARLKCLIYNWWPAPQNDSPSGRSDPCRKEPARCLWSLVPEPCQHPLEPFAHLRSRQYLWPGPAQLNCKVAERNLSAHGSLPSPGDHQRSPAGPKTSPARRGWSNRDE